MMQAHHTTNHYQPRHASPIMALSWRHGTQYYGRSMLAGGIATTCAAAGASHVHARMATDGEEYVRQFARPRYLVRA